VNKIILICFSFIAIIACKSKKIENRQLLFEWTVTEDYCGGAFPPDELITELRTPKPYTGSVYIHKNITRTDEGKHFTITDGKLEASGLSEGDYYVFIFPTMEESNQKPKSERDQIRHDCEITFNRTPVATFTVDKKSTDFALAIHKVCNPCIEPRP
jgi:hypothetical protein